MYISHCDSCNEVYVGETGRLLRVRLHEHLDQKPPSSAFLKHFTEEKHALFKLNTEKLLHSEDSLHCRWALETLDSVRHAHAGFNVLNYSLPTESVIRHIFP